MKIAVLGGGALGSVFGALLAEGGLCEVTLVSRRHEHVDAINSKGLTVKTLDGKELVARIKADTKIAGEPDLVLLTVKAYDVESALAQVKEFGCPVLCLQNGIGIEELATGIVGKDRVIRGITFVGATFTGPGCVTLCYENFAKMGGTLIGQHGHSEKIAEVLSNSQISTKVTEDITGAVWTKALFNCGTNAFSVLTGLRYGELSEVPGPKEAMFKTVEEGERVAESFGVKADRPQEKMLQVMKSAAKHKPSMLQDIEVGRRTEIDFLNGAISRLGRQNGVPTPLNDVITALVKGREKKRSPENMNVYSPKNCGVTAITVIDDVENKYNASNREHWLAQEQIMDAYDLHTKNNRKIKLTEIPIKIHEMTKNAERLSRKSLQRLVDFTNFSYLHAYENVSPTYKELFKNHDRLTLETLEGFYDEEDKIFMAVYPDVNNYLEYPIVTILIKRTENIPALGNPLDGYILHDDFPTNLQDYVFVEFLNGATHPAFSTIVEAIKIAEEISINMWADNDKKILVIGEVINHKKTQGSGMLPFYEEFSRHFDIYNRKGGFNITDVVKNYHVKEMGQEFPVRFIWKIAKGFD